MSGKENPTNNFDKEYQEEDFKRVDSKRSIQESCLLWKILWFLSNQSSDKIAFTTLIQISLALGFKKGPIISYVMLLLKTLEKTH